MTRIRKVWLWVGGSLGLLLLAAVLGVVWGEATGWPVLQQPLQQALTRTAKTPVALGGSFHLHLFGAPHLRVQSLQVAGAQGVDVPHLLQASNVALEWRWRDLWHWRTGGDLRLTSLQADTLDARLVRNADGRASWQLGRDSQASPPRPPTIPRFGLLRVRQGQVLVDDAPLQTQLRVALQGGEGDSDAARADAGYQATALGRWRGVALDLKLRTGTAMGMAMEAAGGPAAASVPLRVEGKAGAASVLFDGTVGSPLGGLPLQGRVHVSGPSLAQAGAPLGLTLPRTPPFDVRGRLGRAGSVWHLQAERLAVGSSLLHADLRFEAAQTPPRLSGRLGGPRLALADLGPALGTRLPGQPPAAPADAGPRRVLPQTVLDLPSLRVMNADVQVAIDVLDFDSAAVAPMRELQTHLRLESGVLQLQALQARVAGGRVTGFTQLDANELPARYAADLKFDGIDIAGWLRGLQAPSADKPAAKAGQTTALKQQRLQARQGGAQTVQSWVTGTLSGSLKANGRGRSTAEILGSLDGQAQLQVRDGSVSHLASEALGLDLAQGLGVLVRGDRPLPLNCARMDLLLKSGLVQPRTAVMDSEDSTTRVDGQVNLRDETIALRAVTKPKDFSPLSLRAPILVGGTLGAPVVGIDGKLLAGKLLGAAALGAIFAPLAALLPLLDTGGSNAGDPCR